MLETEDLSQEDLLLAIVNMVKLEKKRLVSKLEPLVLRGGKIGMQD